MPAHSVRSRFVLDSLDSLHFFDLFDLFDLFDMDDAPSARGISCAALSSARCA